jgi:endonuclease III
VKNATEHAKQLKSLLATVRKQVDLPEPFEMEPLSQLIFASLCADATTDQADAAYSALIEAMVDLNELRVTDPVDLVAIIGRGYPLAEFRIHHLSRVLHAVYQREHGMDMSSVKSMAKREARAYLEELDGITPFVAASVMLLSLGGHAIPVDRQLHARLEKDGVVEDGSELADVQSFLEHHVRADDGPEAYHLLRAYVEQGIPFGNRKKTTRKKTAKKVEKKTAKKVVKKTTRKKTAKKVAKKTAKKK